MHKYLEKTISVAELKEMYKSGKDFEISTPDGYQKVIEWFDKGELQCLQIKLDNGIETTCAFNHLLQLENEAWVLAEELNIGDRLLTENGVSQITSIDILDEIECYDFTIDHYNQRYWGDGISSHNSGKSYLASANLVKNAQKQGILCVIVDTENAIDEEWLSKLGVDTSENMLLKVSIGEVDVCAKFISEFVKGYKDDYSDIPPADRPGVLFIIDSLGMLQTPVDVAQFQSGDISKGSFGTRAKALRALIINSVNLVAEHNIGLVMTNHVRQSSDQYSPDDIISGGDSQIFAASIVIAMKKGKLKEDDSGNKTSEINGIRAMCTIYKSRFNHKALYKKVEIKIPFESGMDPESGLFQFFEDEKMLIKEGNRYSYTGPSGTFKEFRKNISSDQYQILMDDYPSFIESVKPTPEQLEDIDESEED